LKQARFVFDTAWRHVAGSSTLLDPQVVREMMAKQGVSRRVHGASSPPAAFVLLDEPQPCSSVALHLYLGSGEATALRAATVCMSFL